MHTTLKNIVLLFLLLLCQNELYAQEFLGDDLAFFQKKAELYQHWLDAKGMGELLNVDSVRLTRNGNELELFLSIQASDPDTATGLWRGLVEYFRTNTEEELGTVLYQTFARLMEIPHAQGNVQIYIPNKDGFGYDKCFYVWFWAENGSVLEESRVNNCRGQDLKIPVTLPRASMMGGEGKEVLYKRADARAVFEHILAYAKAHYEQPKEGCDNRQPQVEEEEMTDYSLTFTVTDLCREVLTDEKESLWCKFVKQWWGPCNDMRRERLEFTFNYIPTDEGYLLTGSLTGKFGSGVYRPRKSGYMDMEPDFEEDFLEPYVIKFQKQLRVYLESRD